MFRIFYRFKNSPRDTHHLEFSSSAVSVHELKDRIIQQANIHGLIELETEDGEPYNHRQTVLKNTIVIVSRSVNAKRDRQKCATFEKKSPRSDYICHRCNQPGHYIKNCPTNGNPEFDILTQRINGIPVSMTKQISGSCPSTGALLLPNGTPVVLVPNAQVFEASKESRIALTIPEELRCSLCLGLFKKPMFMPCCKTSFCASCLEPPISTDPILCPVCTGQKVTSFDKLVFNQELDAKIQEFEKEKGITTSEPSETPAEVSSVPPLIQDNSPLPPKLRRKPTSKTKDLLKITPKRMKLTSLTD